eukprot:Rhum_TRINITY_DN15408_c8_g1::Rhum_TRINITY_DN15408_c8_g1_i1::g.155505::m.155505
MSGPPIHKSATFHSRRPSTAAGDAGEPCAFDEDVSDRIYAETVQALRMAAPEQRTARERRPLKSGPTHGAAGARQPPSSSSSSAKVAAAAPNKSAGVNPLRTLAYESLRRARRPAQQPVAQPAAPTGAAPVPAAASAPAKPAPPPPLPKWALERYAAKPLATAAAPASPAAAAAAPAVAAATPSPSAGDFAADDAAATVAPTSVGDAQSVTWLTGPPTPPRGVAAIAANSHQTPVALIAQGQFAHAVHSISPVGSGDGDGDGNGGGGGGRQHTPQPLPAPRALNFSPVRTRDDYASEGDASFAAAAMGKPSMWTYANDVDTSLGPADAATATAATTTAAASEDAEPLSSEAAAQELERRCAACSVAKPQSAFSEEVWRRVDAVCHVCLASAAAAAA